MVKAPKKAAKSAAAKKPRQKREPKQREPKAAKAEPAAAKPTPPRAGGNSIDRDRQNLARVHRDKFIRLKAAQSKANRDMTALGKLIKDDGFTKKQIQIMAQLVTPEGEAAVKLTIAQSLEAARFSGSEIGNQLDLFMEPDRTPATDVAYEQGVQDSMDAKSAISPYDPSLPQTQAYLKGYADDQERRMKNGFKPIEPKDGPVLITAAEKESLAKAEADLAAFKAQQNKPVVPSPTSGQSMSRKEYLEQQQAAKREAEAVFEKPAPDRAEVLATAREENDEFFDSAGTKH